MFSQMDKTITSNFNNDNIVGYGLANSKCKNNLIERIK